jgi:hypothetical protein
VTLPDGSVSTVLAGSGQTLCDVLSPLAAKLQSGLEFFDVVLANSEEVSSAISSDILVSVCWCENVGYLTSSVCFSQPSSQQQKSTWCVSLIHRKLIVIVTTCSLEYS